MFDCRHPGSLCFFYPYVVTTLEFLCFVASSGCVFNYNFQMDNLEVHRFLFKHNRVMEN